MGTERLDAISRAEQEAIRIASLARGQDKHLTGTILTLTRDRVTGQFFVCFPEITVDNGGKLSIAPSNLRELDRPLEDAVEIFEMKYPGSPFYCNGLAAEEIVKLADTEISYQDDKQLLLMRPYGVLNIITP